MKRLLSFFYILIVDFLVYYISCVVLSIPFAALNAFPVLENVVSKQLPDAGFIFPMLIAQSVVATTSPKLFSYSDLYGPLKIYGYFRIGFSILIILLAIFLLHIFNFGILVYIYSIFIGYLYLKMSAEVYRYSQQ